MKALEHVELELRERVAWVTLKRPESLNAFTPQMGRELLAALDHVAGAAGARALVLTGAGRGFSSGADLKQVAHWGADGRPDLRAPLREIFHPLILRLRTLELPVIAAVNGGAAGFGCSLALAADVVLAARSAYFLLAFANVGLTLDGGSSMLLVGRAGHGRAMEMALLAERVDAERALAWGLANRVVDDDQLASAADELATRLAAGAPGSHAAIKRSLNQAAYPRLAEQLELEADLQQQRAESADFSEGVRAFLEKRPAQFTGD
ncbi:MAG: enoyl-CoA hydratase/isomerase family protein [Acidobacteriota bacterium]|nr:enoyl-CoA hydratase/isomerase family protein [Acidobacteriota bacterium]